MDFFWNGVIVIKSSKGFATWFFKSIPQSITKVSIFSFHVNNEQITANSCPSINYTNWSKMPHTNREKKQNFSLIHKFTKRWRTISKTVLFTFLGLIMALKEGITGVGKTQNQLSYKYVQSSGEILN